VITTDAYVLLAVAVGVVFVMSAVALRRTGKVITAEEFRLVHEGRTRALLTFDNLRPVLVLYGPPEEGGALLGLAPDHFKTLFYLPEHETGPGLCDAEGRTRVALTSVGGQPAVWLCDKEGTPRAWLTLWETPSMIEQLLGREGSWELP